MMQLISVIKMLCSLWRISGPVHSVAPPAKAELSIIYYCHGCSAPVPSKNFLAIFVSWRLITMTTIYDVYLTQSRKRWNKLQFNLFKILRIPWGQTRGRYALFIP